jgi:methyltransferase family protein
VIAETLGDWSFRLLGPDAEPGPDGHFHVRRPDGSVATLIQTATCRIESAIVDFGAADAHLRAALNPLLPIRRMSRLANAAVLNAAVGEMDPSYAFVNVGVWNGFTFLAAMAGNEERICVGVDNFSEFGGPKQQFLERFVARRTPSHRFFDQDYVDFFAAGLDHPLGVYLYDGEHSYENQYRGLMIADPFYAEDAIVIVDDTNLDRAHEATMQFAEDSRLDWEVVFDRKTASMRHPTLWNGLMILQAGSGRGRVEWPLVDSIEDSLVLGGEGDERVSVLALGDEDLSALESAGHEVVGVGGREELREALLASKRRFVLIAEPGANPAPAAVAKRAQAAADRAANRSGGGKVDV